MKGWAQVFSPKLVLNLEKSNNINLRFYQQQKNYAFLLGLTTLTGLSFFWRQNTVNLQQIGEFMQQKEDLTQDIQNPVIDISFDQLLQQNLSQIIKDEVQVETTLDTKYYFTPTSRQSTLTVFSGNSHRELTAEICAHLDVSQGRITIEKDPSGETKVQILESVRDQKIFVVQSLSAPNLSDQVIETALIISALQRAGAQKVILVIPYIAYSRPKIYDQNHIKGQRRDTDFSSKILRMYEKLGCSSIVTINISNNGIKGFIKNSDPIINVDCSEISVPYFVSKGVQDPIILTTDGEQHNIKQVRNMCEAFKSSGGDPDLGFCVLEIDQREQKFQNAKCIGTSHIKNRDCIIYAPIVHNAKRIQIISEYLQKEGAKDIYAFSPHGIFTLPSLYRIEESPLKEVVVTNTVPSTEAKSFEKIQYLSISQILAEIISQCHSNQSLEKFRGHKDHVIENSHINTFLP